MDCNGDGKVDFGEFERAMLGEDRSELSFCAGDLVDYKSKTLGRWVECNVMAVERSSGRLRISAKPDVWLYPEEARALLRHSQQSPQRSQDTWSPVAGTPEAQPQVPV